ncbi:MAG: hypothetical protein KDC26_04650 [Armatimonadetes bacterium]|nr:hypothetical protein [Armatimonadota bacterium]
MRNLTLALFAVASVSAFAQSEIDVSNRSQFIQRSGYKLESGNDRETYFGVSGNTSPGATGFGLNYYIARTSSFYGFFVNQTTFSSNTAINAGFYGERFVYSFGGDEGEGHTARLIYGFNHTKPSFNYSTVGVTVASPDFDGFGYNATFSWIKTWSNGSDNDGVLADLGFYYGMPDTNCRFDAGYIFESGLAGEDDYFLRMSKNVGDATLRLKHMKNNRWGFDVIIPF